MTYAEAVVKTRCLASARSSRYRPGVRPQYRILVVDESVVWRDLGEGPWESYAAALEFADSEVGVPWVLVGPRNEPLAFGDRRGAAG